MKRRFKVFRGVYGAQSLVFFVVLCRSFFPFDPFLLVIVLSIFPRFLASDYPLGIFKFFVNSNDQQFHQYQQIQQSPLAQNHRTQKHHDIQLCKSISCIWKAQTCDRVVWLIRYNPPLWSNTTVVTDSGYLFSILWSLCCLSFDLRILVTSLVSSNS